MGRSRPREEKGFGLGCHVQVNVGLRLDQLSPYCSVAVGLRQRGRLNWEVDTPSLGSLYPVFGSLALGTSFVHLRSINEVLTVCCIVYGQEKKGTGLQSSLLV